QSLTVAGVPTGAADGFEMDDFTLSGKVGLLFKPVENASIYTSAGVSTQPPGSYLSIPDISRTCDNAFPGLVGGAKSVRNVNYELGLMWDFAEGLLSTTAAVFHTEKRNVAVLGRDVPGGDPAGTNDLQGYH